MLSKLFKRFSTNSVFVAVSFICIVSLVLILKAKFNIFLGLFVIAVFSALLLFVRIEYSIFGIILSVFVLDQLVKSYSILPAASILVREIMICLMFIFVFLKVLENWKVAKTPIDAPVTFFVILGMFSFLLNEISPLKAALGFRHYLLYVVFFYLIVNIPLKKNMLIKIINLLFTIALLSGPVALLERFVFGWAYEDTSAGFLSSGSFALFGTAMVCLVSARIMQDGFRLKYLLILISLFSTALLAETKAFFFFTPLCLLFQFRSRIIKHKKVLLSFLASFLLVILSINYATSFHPLTELKEYVLNPSKLWWYLTIDTDAHGGSLNYLTRAGIYENVTLSRVSKIVYSHIQAKKNPFNMIFGHGPGSVSPNTLLKLGVNEQWEGMGLDQVQLSKTVMELGYLGFFLFLLIIYKIYKMNISFYKNIQDDYWRSISVGFSGIIFLYVIGIIYNSVWVINSISFIFWFLSASLLIVAKRSFSR